MTLRLRGDSVAAVFRLTWQQSRGQVDAPVIHDRFEFEDFCLDRRSGGLFRQDDAGGVAPLAIGSRALDVLGVLVSRPGDLLSKHAIMQAVWPGITVDEKNLTVQIAALRRILDNGRTDRSCIQTEAGRGYPLRGTRHQERAGRISSSAPVSADVAGYIIVSHGGRVAVGTSTASALSHDGGSGGV